ncbi:MAG: Cu(I)/Ag(I) efflux system membrane fusion protein, partial [Polaribacter sp.]
KEAGNFSKVQERLVVSKGFQNQLKLVFNEYITLKNALVREDSKDVMRTSKNLLAFLSKVDVKLLEKKETRNHWMFLEKEIQLVAALISNTAQIKAQRNYFKQVSAAVINSVQVFGINEKVFVSFCPMADNNKGAYWLSKEEKVINPYFGNAMLTCGEIKQVIE